VLSKPLTEPRRLAAPIPGAGDWFVLIDATNVNAASTAIATRLADGYRAQIRGDFFPAFTRLMWGSSRRMTFRHRVFAAMLQAPPHKRIFSYRLRSTPESGDRAKLPLWIILNGFNTISR